MTGPEVDQANNASEMKIRQQSRSVRTATRAKPNSPRIHPSTKVDACHHPYADQDKMQFRAHSPETLTSFVWPADFSPSYFTKAFK